MTTYPFRGDSIHRLWGMAVKGARAHSFYGPSFVRTQLSFPPPSVATSPCQDPYKIRVLPAITRALMDTRRLTPPCPC